MYSGLLPNEIRNRMIKDKADIVSIINKAQAYEVDKTLKNIEDFFKEVGTIKEILKTELVAKYSIEYDIVKTVISIDIESNKINISNKADVYFQTMDKLNVKKYKNKGGKYTVQDLDGVTYWVTCKEYDWARVKVL